MAPKFIGTGSCGPFVAVFSPFEVQFLDKFLVSGSNLKLALLDLTKKKRKNIRLYGLVNCSLVPSRTRKKYVWQNLCTILGLSDVAIPDSGWPIKSLLVTFSDA